MNRKQFIEANGGECKNWRWSWSFVNHEERFVIFGAWDIEEGAGRQVILKDEWAINPKTGGGHGAFTESIEYIDLVRNEGYDLKTFRMTHGLADPYAPKGSAKIKSFEKKLVAASLRREGSMWVAYDLSVSYELPDEFTFGKGSDLIEGSRKLVSVNRFERSGVARQKCIEIYGATCAVCSFNFGEVYGEAADGFIHVHHLKPLAEIDESYQVNPEQDLVPVCPNCHAVIHRRSPPFSLTEVKSMMQSNTELSE